MCGIAAIFHGSGSEAAFLAEIDGMVSRLRHRGPDARGTWTDAAAGVALGHARLSILDLSEAGSQPMVSGCGRWAISYNGEVYNFADLKKELAERGHAFRGNSDTEVALAAIAEWGVEKALGRFVGMFAFALWDRQERRLWLGRDRLGIKPLYYGLFGGRLLVASELKAFRGLPGVDLAINRDALAAFFRHNCIPAPHCVYENLHKLRPGHLLCINREDLDNRQVPDSRPFWSARDVVATRGGGVFTGGPEQAVEALEEVLSEAVGCRMIADVPLGAFLSGGIDSSTVAALMQAQSGRPVKTFSIGFDREGYNEATHAAAVARHLGTDHSELYVREQEAQAVIPELPVCYDEPFADSSQIPTLLVSRLARREVTVALSGDGGDELFCGYNRYHAGWKAWQRLRSLPGPGRRLLQGLLTSRSPEQWDRLYARVEPALPESLRLRLPGNKAHKMAALLPLSTPQEVYRSLVSHWKDPAAFVIGANEPLTNVTDPAMQLDSNAASFPEKMMYLDLVSYLPDDILTKVDRASMGVGLEARVPLLDHRVVEFAWSLPHSLKVRGGDSKWILRKVLEKHVPRHFHERPKMGFGIPLGEWLRGDLRDWAEDLLDEGRLHREGYLRPEPVRECWRQHLEGSGDYGYQLWDVLMFQAWLQHWA